ncbi:IS5 family transposase [Oxyplasma meridianum]|uniref:IS5 family transposase n=1 Tax=Oxyplasma meridianum TaxID=3073602 RepID=A0AAX4NHP0_9ARCH
MSSLLDVAIKEKYTIMKINDPLVFVKNAIDWSVFSKILKGMYHNDTERGGASNIPIITMVKVLYLQSAYNMVDEQAETMIRDRISFMNFLDYPDRLPDARTIWIFRERLSKTGKDRAIWNELNRQLREKRIIINNGSLNDIKVRIEAQDSMIITADPGKHGKKKPPVSLDPHPPADTKNTGKEQKEKKMTREEKRHAKIMAAEKKRIMREERRYSETRRSKDGTHTKKGSKGFFGYKGHTGVDEDVYIDNYIVTTASVHDASVNLSVPGKTNFRDKGYFGSPCNGRDGTMDRAVRGSKLSIDQVRRNKRISRKRSMVEHPYAVIRRAFHFSHVLVTMVRRVRVKFMFACMGYNIYRLRSQMTAAAMEVA